ncbi:uncharacterized protein B0P05DRAFT_559794 [Gilbertella persicaria]|uniref:Uncharacterized protein n=1 Tax=Rhizopus stolonifer TaxID=4846 RepID=A0A367KRE0_RHIST|nr:uncharacterized protein B0P05DRAFT_559794 [Gilbertella persicaria]KAI8057571.1 hypothetical protein B0P05DRAFT_559794 [Gilbertella persicaria]RCI04756.1 hypothetical protein CU098_012842 [Rhizopus stolonifer]
MAFIQQQRRPTYRTLNFSSSSLEECSDYAQQQPFTSDSDNDWHVISSALPSSTSPISTTSSPLLLASNRNHPSDTESFSDLDANAFLPSHDGTGTFLMEDSSDQNSLPSSDEDSPTEFEKAIHGLMLDHTEDEVDSDQDVLDLLATIEPPSFTKVEPSHFIPTTAGIGSQDLVVMGVSSSSAEIADHVVASSDENNSATSIKFTSKRQQNLDSIPVHHPGIPGSNTSNAILSVVWNSLRKITNHLIENDTNTVETISSLMSEAVFEGCMPFGSHLHMEIDNSIRTSSSFFEHNIAAI